MLEEPLKVTRRTPVFCRKEMYAAVVVEFEENLKTHSV